MGQVELILAFWAKMDPSTVVWSQEVLAQWSGLMGHRMARIWVDLAKATFLSIFNLLNLT